MSTAQKMQMLQSLRKQVNDLNHYVASAEAQLTQKESAIRQGMSRAETPQQLERNLAKIFGPMAPGNVGDINKVVWPYMFTTAKPESSIGFQQTFQTSLSITQEAAFIMTSFTKAIYRDDGAAWTYLDPNIAGGEARNLSFTISDRSSSRQFYNFPMQASMYGNPRFPTVLPKPMMFLPNQQIQVQFTNTHPDVSYIPTLTVMGVRCRIEDAQNILSLIYG